MATESELVIQTVEKSSAHGLPRIVVEKKLYIRVLWLLIWLVFCGLFIRQLIGFAIKLQADEVTTNFRADAVPFEYPDLYFCFDNPLSGSRHLKVSRESANMINKTFKEVINTLYLWCNELDDDACENLVKEEAAEIQINSLPFRFLVDKMGHIPEQSLFIAELVKTNGLVYNFIELDVTDFYHPSHLRCFRISLNEMHRAELQFAGPEDSLYFLAMMDAPDLRMGHPNLPVVRTYGGGTLTAPYWTLDKSSQFTKAKGSTLRVYVTKPGHYPSDFDSVLILEAGRSYNVQLEMEEQVHKEDPDRCVDHHHDVQIVNPYNNSAYTFLYDYAYCYNSAVQAQFKREVNATCAFLPHPWPPADRSLYNLSSGWGSAEDATTFLTGKNRLRPNEPLEMCATSRPCTERMYIPTIESVLWPSVDTIDSIFEGTRILDDEFFPDAPGLKYLRELSKSENSSQNMFEYIRANFLQIQVTVKKPNADQIIFSKAYSFESFVADIGGILGIYLGMSLLTVCELMQFFHDFVLLCRKRRLAATIDLTEKKTKSSVEFNGIRSM